MRFFFAMRRRWPTVGLALAAGFLVGDCLLVLGPYMNGFKTGSLGLLLLGALGMYVLLTAGLDLVIQLLGPTGIARSLWIRMGTILAVAAGLVIAAAEVRSLPLLGVAALFAVLALGRFTWPVAVVIAGFALFPVVKSPPAREAPPNEVASHLGAAAATGPSFVVVVLDTVRFDHTSVYGYHRDTTPNLARLAARGVRFERAYTTSNWSLPSHASLFTGLQSSHHGAHSEHLLLDDHHPTLAEILAVPGYETANFTSNAWISPGTGMSRGFQLYRESWRRTHVDFLLLAKRVYFSLLAPDRDKGGADLVAGIRRWSSERDSTRPYFLFVNVFEAHAPYQHVPREFRRRFAAPDLSLHEMEAIGTRVTTATQNGNLLSQEDAAIGLDLLDGAIAAADALLGEILELVGDDPIVVVVADHGELCGEHTLFGHSNTLYEPLIRIPMVMAGRHIPKGSVLSEVVSLVDIMPTLLAMAGVDGPEVDGEDLGPLLGGSSHGSGRPVRAEQFSPAKGGKGWRHHRGEQSDYLLARKEAVVDGTLKRIVSEEGSDLGYDLKLDPAEQHPFEGAETELDARVPDPGASQTIATIDPLQQKVLQALGYLQ
jgi:arylsulfatase A-like enzyme